MNRKIVLAGAFCALAAQGAFAGGLAEPTMEPEVVAAETAASSSGGIIVPLLLLLIVVAAASGGSTPPT